MKMNLLVCLCVLFVVHCTVVAAEFCTNSTTCKKPSGVRAEIQKGDQENNLFCAGAVVTLYCKSNRVLVGPKELILSQMVECLDTGWSIDLSTVRCLDQQNSLGQDVPPPATRDQPTARPEAISTQAASEAVSTVPNAATQSYSASVRSPNLNETTRQGYLLTPETSSTLASITKTVQLEIQARTDSNTNDQRTWDVEGYDGWYNNLAHPDWGAADTALTRKSHPAYSDGAYELSGKDRPNPFVISEQVFSTVTGHKSHRGRTVMLTFFGQQVVEEILDAQRPGCPPEYENIPIPKGHHLYYKNVKEMPFLRTRYDMTTGYSPNVPREQLNEITPWIDGGLFYGTTKAWADALRSFVNGSLACDDSECKFPRKNSIGLPMANPPPPRDHVLKSAKRFNGLGNPRGNENPFMLSFGVLWFREHNRHARRLAAAHPDWSDEKIFNRARQWIIAEHQRIVLYEWLPEFLGISIEKYDKYKASVHPGIVHEFQSAAMRFGHTLVPPGVIRRDTNCNILDTTAATGTPGKKGVRTCNSYWNPQDAVEETGIEPLLMGMASQITEREDASVTEDLLGKVFGPLEFSRRDLMALNIQRGRDHGLPDYNTVRAAYGLPKITEWSLINSESVGNPNLRHMQDAIEMARLVYSNDINKLDLWPGGLLETTIQGPGELFQRIIKDQFLRIRDGDWFWFENQENGLFTKEEITIINNTTLKQIIVENTNITAGDIQDNVFINSRFDPTSPCYFDPLRAEELENCTEWKTYDYFSGSEASYISVFTLTGLFIVFLFVLMYILALRRQSAVSQILPQRSGTTPSADDIVHGVQTIRVVELKSDQGTRHVLIFIRTQPHKEILITDDNSRKLRTIGLTRPTEITLQQAFDDHTLLLLRVPRTHDFIMRFSTVESRNFFSQHLTRQMAEIGTDVKVEIMRRKELLSKAITKKRRQKLVAEFLREVFAYASNERQGRVDEAKLKQRVLDCQLTKEEFAESLSLKSDSLFVDQMFRLADTDGDGVVTFREFFSLIVVFTHGTADQKLQLMFQLYDITQNGRLERISFKEMFVAMMEMVNASVDTDCLNQLCDSMFTSAGLHQKDYLTFEDFQRLLDGHKDALTDLNLNVQVPGYGSPHIKRKRKGLKASASSASSVPSHIIKKLRHVKSEPTFSPERKISTDGQNSGHQENSIVSLSNSHITAVSGHKSRTSECSEVSAFTERRGCSGGLHLDLSEDCPDHETVTSSKLQRYRLNVVRAYFSPMDEHPPYRLPPGTGEEQTEERQDIDQFKTEPKYNKSRKDSIVFMTTGWLERKWTGLFTFVENYRRQIFFLVLYHLLVLAIFAERAYYFSFEREHAGLRRIAGYGVSVTRGAASAMMFTYSSLVVTMCRNLITWLRETPLNQYIPFDSFHGFHKWFALTALFFTVVHVLGHALNFYHIATQPADDLTCLFREVYHLSDELPKFHYWLFNTITGVTSVLLLLVTATIYVFATPFARRYTFNAFWLTHKLCVVFYVLMFLHGCGRLVQDPIFYFFFIGPLALFVVDRLISVKRTHTKLSVIKAELLPSDVTHLQLKKPDNFEYRSGQWVQIACVAHGRLQFHPFTLTSAPHEDTLSVHIRSVGPWTRNIRLLYDPANLVNQPYPKLVLDGPFGEGHQDWCKYEVAVMVGGGIGVTPFASILKDIVKKTSMNTRFKCQSVFFLWVTRTQRQFEWFADILREVEEQDRTHLVNVHIFITQFYNKFDFRTTMLYICERHFQRVSNRSLFTGLRAVTHFGRPEFGQFFSELRGRHQDTKKIGVFSCGPPPMTASVQSACADLNEIEGPTFIHHYENF